MTILDDLAPAGYPTPEDEERMRRIFQKLLRPPPPQCKISIISVDSTRQIIVYDPTTYEPISGKVRA